MSIHLSLYITMCLSLIYLPHAHSISHLSYISTSHLSLLLYISQFYLSLISLTYYIISHAHSISHLYQHLSHSLTIYISSHMYVSTSLISLTYYISHLTYISTSLSLTRCFFSIPLFLKAQTNELFLTTNT